MTIGSCGTDSDAEAIFYLMMHQFVAYGMTQDRWVSSNNLQTMADNLSTVPSAVLWTQVYYMADPTFGTVDKDSPQTCLTTFYNYASITAWTTFNKELWGWANRVNNFVTLYWPPRTQVAFTTARGMLMAGLLSGMIKTTTWVANKEAYYHSLEEEFANGSDILDQQVDISPYMFH